MIKNVEMDQIIELLRKFFPKVFNEERSVLLKKGIFFDIDERLLGISRTRLRVFFKMYTRSNKYLKAHKVGSNRYDLNGDICGEVTLEEIAYAKEIRNSRKKKKIKIEDKKSKELSTSEKQDENEINNISTESNESIDNKESIHSGRFTLKLFKANR